MKSISTRPATPAKCGTVAFALVGGMDRLTPRKMRVVLRKGGGSDQVPAELPSRGITGPVNSFGALLTTTPATAQTPPRRSSLHTKNRRWSLVASGDGEAAPLYHHRGLTLLISFVSAVVHRVIS